MTGACTVDGGAISAVGAGGARERGGGSVGISPVGPYTGGRSVGFSAADDCINKEGAGPMSGSCGVDGGGVSAAPAASTPPFAASFSINSFTAVGRIARMLVVRFILNWVGMVWGGW